MKFRKLPLISLLALGSISLSGCFIEITPSGSKLTGSYYEGVNLKLTGGRLVNELQTLMFKTHKNWVRYSQVNSYFSTTSSHNSAEAIADGSKVNQWFYTGKEAGGVGTREHVWPCANSDGLWEHSGKGIHNVDGNYYIGGGSDLYHVRTSNSDVNTARGNSRFIDFDDPEFSDITDTMEFGEKNGKWNIKVSGYGLTAAGKPQYSQKCEPDDNMKGDVARIVLYLWVHYGERGNTPSGSVKSGSVTYAYSDMTGGLNFSGIMGYSSDEKSKAALAEWNRIDPPSEVEKLRNETVQKIQGNRNPFVDHPEIVDQLLGIKK